MNRLLRTTLLAVLLLSSAAAGARPEIRWAERLPEGEGERYRAFSERLHTMLERDPDTEIIRIDTDAAAEAAEAVAGWIETWISGIRI